MIDRMSSPATRTTVLAILAAILSTAATASPAPSAPQLEYRIKTTGARGAVASLSPAQLDAVVGKAATGDERWLRVAVALRAGTDGANTEGIDGALSAALATNPAGVLRLIGEGHGLELPAICEDRAIEPSDQQVKAFLSRSTAALQAVRDPSLVSLRDACVVSLRHTAAAS